MEKKTGIQKKAVCLVAEQIINMLDNNVLNDGGVEGFSGWCEDGNVFYESDEPLDQETIDAAILLMGQVAPLVDKLTYEWLNFGY